MSTIPSTGWYIEVDHPGGHTWTVDPLDGIQWLPNLNGKPELRVPVPRSRTRWLDADWEGAEPDMRAWKDGTRMPIDELRTVETTAEEIVLVGEGGRQLDDPVDIEISQKEAWLAGRDAVQNNTTYATNFDDPDDTAEERKFQDVSTESEFRNNLLSPIDDIDPWVIRNGGVETFQSSFTREGEAFDRGSGSLSNSKDSYSDGQAEGFNDGGYLEWDFTIDYDIPEGEFAIYYRNDATGTSDVPAVTWYLDGNKIGSTNELTSLSWDEVYDASGGGTPPRIEAGTHTIRAEGESGTFSNSRFIDVIAPLDDRYSYLFDNDNGGGGGYLDGPQLHPVVDVPFDDSSSVFSIVAGRATSSWTATDDGQAVAVSNDKGRNYTTNANSTSIDTSFADAGATIRFRATIGRTGSRNTATPKTGFKSQRIDSYELYGDVEDSPVLVNRRAQGSLEQFLTTIADYGNFIWELQWDEAAGSMSVEFTRPGQRSATSTAGLSSYQQNKDLRTYQKATVRGSFQSRSGEQITANHGTAVALDRDNLVTSRESVIDPNDGTEYERRVDYDIDYTAGEITTLSTGSITDGQSLTVDYQFVPKASFAADGFDPSTDRALPPVKINSVTTDREAEQAALTIKQDIDSPLVEATVTLSRLQAGRSLVDDLKVDQLPTDLGFEIRELERTPEQIVLQLGSRRQLSEVIADIEQRLSATQERA